MLEESLIDQENITVLKNFIDSLPEKALSLGIRILFAIVFFFVGVWIIKLIRKLVRKSMNRAGAETGAVQFVDSFIKAGLYIVLIFMIASSFGLDAASVVALIGSAGVAIGLAVQGSLSNFAGGVLLLVLKPFKVGDYIIEGTTNKEGTVTEIKIFYTKLLTIDNKVVVLPNGNLANHTLVNVTDQAQRKLDINLYVSYSADLKRTKETLREVLLKNAHVDTDKEILVAVDELADSGIKIIMRAWVKTSEYWDAKWEILEQSKNALDNAGIEIPYPQIDIHMK